MGIRGMIGQGDGEKIMRVYRREREGDLGWGEDREYDYLRSQILVAEQRRGVDKGIGSWVSGTAHLGSHGSYLWSVWVLERR